ncbi:MAG: T9SS type A sorting domain-containing protein [Flavobacteriales bacterium]|nr:T9SS type A sorting domain-containing protein [Flavobacteriales bacterium]
MKHLLFAILIISIIPAQAQVTEILFIGNSYTYVNDLPLLLKNVALSFGDTIVSDQNTPGGYQLIQHSTNTTTLSKIASRNWDFVVIQEQSQKPSFSPSQVANDVYPYAQILNDSIKSNYSCSESIFYMTWGRKNGDAGNCASNPSICTYAGMQQRLRDSYMQMSSDNNATTSPVGAAWATVRDSFPSIELYAADESHPSIYGSYLAACVFYATLYQKSPIGSSYIPAAISLTDALSLQTVASYTVLDSLLLWRIGVNLPVANFNYSGGSTINFTSTSTNVINYFWNFGDGNTSTQQNPSNTYTSSNTYPVKLITFSSDNCFSDTIVQNVNVIISGIDAINTQKEISIYPNPATDFIQLKTNLKYTSILIMDVTGETIIRSNYKTSIDISNLTKGIYFVKIMGEKKPVIKKFVKE